MNHYQLESELNIRFVQKLETLLKCWVITESKLREHTYVCGKNYPVPNNNTPQILFTRISLLKSPFFQYPQLCLKYLTA